MNLFKKKNYATKEDLLDLNEKIEKVNKSIDVFTKELEETLKLKYEHILIKKEILNKIEKLTEMINNIKLKKINNL